MIEDPCIYDILVIGGGINGSGVAVDAAGRGLNVLLCEMNDLASATSSASSKLIHGGLRYLEHYQFRLVREALYEREVLMRKAPHIVHPLRFQLPHRPHLRAAWMIRIGLFIYDSLGKREALPGSVALRYDENSPLIPGITRGFEYSDAWVDDSRLVILNALHAKQKGATILTYHECMSARSKNNHWIVTLKDNQTGNHVNEIKARAIVNAAGPWVNDLFSSVFQHFPPKEVRLIKGSHIIVPKIHNEAYAFILQNVDGRIVFVIPYEEAFSLIGTTDEDFTSNPSDAVISENEIDYLIETVNQYFKNKITANNIVSSFSGVRSLIDGESKEAQAVSRDYHLELEHQEAPLLSIYGGKITTYRKVAEHVMDKLRPFFSSMGKNWTKHIPLPGGEFDSIQQLNHELISEYPWLPPALVNRWVRSYGTLCRKFITDTNKVEDLGFHFGQGLYEKEVDYLVEHEWAVNTDDILSRRSKLGLKMNNDEVEKLDRYLQ